MNNRNWNPESDECDVLDIANRTAAILIDEITEWNLSATDKTGKKPKLTVIDPLIPVHGWTQLNIGLLKIDADQGYMRAFDVLCAESTPIYDKCERLTAVITLNRIKIWALEHQLIKDWSEIKGKSQSAVIPLLDGPETCGMHHCCENVVDTKILEDIRQMKKELKECIDRRRDVVEHSSLSAIDKKHSLPEDYPCMYMCWEPHNWRVEGEEEKPLIPTPWHRLDLGELGSDVIEEDWSLGRPPFKCKSRSLLRFGAKSHNVRVD